MATLERLSTSADPGLRGRAHREASYILPFPQFFSGFEAVCFREPSPNGTPPTRAQTSLLFLTGPSLTAASRPRDFLSGGTGRPVPCPEKSLNCANFRQGRPLPPLIPPLDPPTPFSFYRFRAVLRNPPLCYPPTQPIPNIFDGSKDVTCLGFHLYRTPPPLLRLLRIQRFFATPLSAAKLGLLPQATALASPCSGNQCRCIIGPPFLQGPSQRGCGGFLNE